MITKIFLIRLLIVLLFFVFLSCGGGGGGGSSASSASALCNDGTYSYSSNCSGTCSSHGGVKEWYNNCGRSPERQFLSVDSDVSSDKSAFSGLWEGNWVNKYDQLGLMHIDISEYGSIEGIFLNSDYSLDSKIHGYLNEQGVVSLFMDYFNGSKIEYEGYGTFVILNNALSGIITVRESWGEEIRKIFIYRR